MSPVLGKLCTECLCQRKTGSSPSDLTELGLEGKEFPKETRHASQILAIAQGKTSMPCESQTIKFHSMAIFG